MKAFVAVSLRKPLVGKLQKISAIYRYASRFFPCFAFAFRFRFPSSKVTSFVRLLICLLFLPDQIQNDGVLRCIEIEKLRLDRSRDLAYVSF